MDRSKFKVGVVSLGCDKNRVDTERMLSKISESGYGITSEPSEADVIIVNTCAFINAAREESINTIFDMAAYKRERCKKLVVTGCLPQKHMEELKNELVEADCLLGTEQYGEIDSVLDALLDKNERVCDKSNITQAPKGRVLTTPRHYAYLKIADGCDNFCTYCTIPKIRGKYISESIEKLVDEARGLVEGGVKELILVAQDVTAYGVDLYGKQSLPLLVSKLAKIEGLAWIRLLYCYPERIDDEFIEMMKCEKVVKYLDVPVQHACDSVLKRMGRKSNENELKELFAKLRSEIKGLTLRTTFMIGFPGETEQDFETLIRFIKEQKIDNAGFFAYSTEEGTPSEKLDGRVPEEEKEKRVERAYLEQQIVAKALAKELVGKNLRVIVDDLAESDSPDYFVYVARGQRNAPDIDGVIYVRSKNELVIGDFYDALITQSEDYDLIGEVTL